jgi:ketopantoate reductase
MRIGIYGAGCIGLYLGGRLLASASATAASAASDPALELEEVVFVGRQRMEGVLRQFGLNISSYDQPVSLLWACPCAALLLCCVVLCCVVLCCVWFCVSRLSEMRRAL